MLKVFFIRSAADSDWHFNSYRIGISDKKRNKRNLSLKDKMCVYNILSLFASDTVFYIKSLDFIKNLINEFSKVQSQYTKFDCFLHTKTMRK